MSISDVAKRRLVHTGLMVSLAALLLVSATASQAGKKPKAAKAAPAVTASASPMFCSDTAELQEQACVYEVRDDNLVSRAKCLNISDGADRAACVADAALALRDGLVSCDEVSDAREDLCHLIGEARYEPDFDPANFDDPKRPTRPNPYFPLAVGSHWTYTEGADRVNIDVLDKTKSIDGVTCLVVHDVVSSNGVPVEDTDDWFATHRNGDIFYCGENVKDYETFPGDSPVEAELTSTAGSFKVGVDGDKGGIVFPGDPRPGRTDRQEWAASNAEDAATVITNTYRYGARPELDRLVPAALARLLCSAGDCVVTNEFSPTAPSAFAFKYYARGVGRFLEVNPIDGTIVQLISCNVDRRCSSLPQP